MGLIDPMLVNTAVATGVVPFGQSMVLWASMIGVLSAATAAIVAAVPRQRRSAKPVRLVRPAIAH